MAKIVNEVPENWREELATFIQTDEGKEFFNTSIRRPDGNLGMKPIPMIEYGKIVEIIEFIFADDKLYSALEEYCIYQNQVEEADHVHATDADFAHIKMPVEARDEIFDFYKWYAMKSLTGYGQILKAATSASELVRQLLALGRRQTLRLELVDLASWISEASTMIDPIIDANIRLTIDIPPGLTVRADPIQLERVLANLTVNAKDAMPSGGALLSSRVGRLTARWNYHFRTQAQVFLSLFLAIFSSHFLPQRT